MALRDGKAGVLQSGNEDWNMAITILSKGATSRFLLLVAVPFATSSFLLLVAMRLVTSSFLFLVVWPGATTSSSFLLLAC